MGMKFDDVGDSDKENISPKDLVTTKLAQGDLVSVEKHQGIGDSAKASDC